METVNMVQTPNLLVKQEMTVRGNLVELFRQIHKRRMEDPNFYTLFLKDPAEALNTLFSGDSWQAIPMDTFEPMFEAAFPEKRIGKTEMAEVPLDPMQFLKLAETISTDKTFSESFRKDPVGVIHRMMGAAKRIYSYVIIVVIHFEDCSGVIIIIRGKISA